MIKGLMWAATGLLVGGAAVFGYGLYRSRSTPAVAPPPPMEKKKKKKGSPSAEQAESWAHAAATWVGVIRTAQGKGEPGPAAPLSSGAPGAVPASQPGGNAGTQGFVAGAAEAIAGVFGG